MRKQEHIWEMQKAATINRYLEDITKQTLIRVRKENLEQDIKKCLLYCFPKLKNYASDSVYGPAALDEVLEFFENVCDGTYKLNTAEGIINCIHDTGVLLQHYEHSDAEEGEATKCKNMVGTLEARLKTKYPNEQKPKSISPHSLDSLLHFKQEMQGLY